VKVREMMKQLEAFDPEATVVIDDPVAGGFAAPVFRRLRDGNVEVTTASGRPTRSDAPSIRSL
jgi:hypothetical protein